MDRRVELTDSAVQRFQGWFRNVAKPAVHIEVIESEMMAAFQEELARGADLVYRLGASNTMTGRAETFSIERSELTH
jgi:hypothetical protein